ncbi:hypothetical protein BCR44DRAFT_44121 [Catenaria anguillulae PL171]|uniref:Uncharacterized protein n=1 Tax=Catenaria anguillulae PL171 TaxID=765915 RepID=A0A1Y2HDG2_9FUNG|nr:hypothetical protein BCR44DRAFT_44121 [Catenaria anguillulae PL171]
MTETLGCFYSVSQICRARFAFVSILANVHVESKGSKANYPVPCMPHVCRVCCALTS